MDRGQIQALIRMNEETSKEGFDNLKRLFDENPRRPYFTERMIQATNLLAELAGRRAYLESELRKAIQEER